MERVSQSSAEVDVRTFLGPLGPLDEFLVSAVSVLICPMMPDPVLILNKQKQGLHVFNAIFYASSLFRLFVLRQLNASTVCVWFLCCMSSYQHWLTDLDRDQCFFTSYIFFLPSRLACSKNTDGWTRAQGKITLELGSRQKSEDVDKREKNCFEGLFLKPVITD